jgi:hypothetical protein
VPVRPHRALAALVLGVVGLAGLDGVQACSLAMLEHRSGQALMRLPLQADRPAFSIAFTHSVLGTPVLDRYEWRTGPPGPRAHLVEEWFEGEGYGLPEAPAAGETLQRVQTTDGPRWRLRLDRPVHPLVVRPLPAQHMRVLVDGQPPVVLGDLTRHAVLLQAEGCSAP